MFLQKSRDKCCRVVNINNLSMFFGEVAEQTVFSEWSRRFENRRPDFYINNLLTF